MSVKLNVGCGKAKWEGFVNIDTEPSLSPDLICDITKTKLPYEPETVDEIYFIHTVEHIEKKYHLPIFQEFHRLLKPDGKLVVAYPDFPRTASYYIENKRGMRDFYENVIYGRQLYPSDFHVSLMDTRVFKRFLAQIGFVDIKTAQEPEPNEHNTILNAWKGEAMKSREDLIREEIFNR